MLNNDTLAAAPNTFIGGVGATSVTSAADYVALCTGITTSNISSFSIDTNNNVSFYVDSAYSIKANPNNFKLDTDITYFIDADQLLSGLATDAFSSTTNLKYWYGGLLSGSLNDGVSRTFISATSLLNVISPLSVTLGFDGGNDAVFQSTTLDNLIVNTSAQTSNGGAVENDVLGEIVKGTNVLYASNTTAPSAVSDLASVDVYGLSISMTMTAPSSSNTILGYEVWVNGAFMVFVETLDFDITGLTFNTLYDIYVHTVDEHGNRSGKSNTVSETTAATYVIPTANIISYWNFDSDSTDQVGANDGTDTSISYVSGYIGNCADFTASTSAQISFGAPADLSFGNGTTDSAFSLITYVKFSSVAASADIIDKRTAANTNKEYVLFNEPSLTRMVFRMFDQSTGGTRDIIRSGTFSTGTWYKVIVRYNGTTGSIFVNGTETSGVTDTGSYTAMENGTGTLLLGKDNRNTTTSLNGYLDETAFFDKYLTDTELDEINAKHLAGLALTA